MKKEKSEERIKYENNQEKNLLSYYLELGNTFNSKINQLSHIIGREHYASIGTYKENLLKSEIKKFLPNNYDVSSGFIIFPKLENKDGIIYNVHDISKQLDIIIYNKDICAPIFQDNGFIVVAPEAVVAIIEVKGYNSSSAKPLDGYCDLIQKWAAYYKLTSQDFYAAQWKPKTSNNNSAPPFYVFNFDEYVDTNNKTYSENESLNYIVQTLKKNIIANPEISGQYFFDNVIKCIPWFDGFFVYNKYSVIYIKDGQYNSICSVSGHLNRKNNVSGDCTFALLLYRLFCYAKIPFNLGTIQLHEELNPFIPTSEFIHIYDITNKKCCD